MTKAELIKEFMGRTGLPLQEATDFIEYFFETIKEALQRDGKILIKNFGKFEIRERKGRKGINPRTKKEMIVPDRKVVFFVPAVNLRKITNQIGKVDNGRTAE